MQRFLSIGLLAIPTELNDKPPPLKLLPSHNAGAKGQPIFIIVQLLSKKRLVLLVQD